LNVIPLRSGGVVYVQRCVVRSQMDAALGDVQLVVAVLNGDENLVGTGEAGL
jgi:hypothetical protein